MASLGLLGVPSSSAAHWPGQEKAPAALRAAGLTALLAEAGHTVIDHGDRPVVRWRPHPHQRRPHDLTRTLDVLRDARSHVAAIFRAGQIPLVVGGECTLTIAVVARQSKQVMRSGWCTSTAAPIFAPRSTIRSEYSTPWAWRTCWTCPVASQNLLA